MSGSGKREVRKDVWEEAGGEFYTESYPSGTGGPTRSSRFNIALPSQTARRNSIIHHGRQSQRKNQTMLSTLGDHRGDCTINGIPDLADLTIPNERTTYEELQKIRSMPVPMSQKKELKSQLMTIPILRLKGLSLLCWHRMKAMESLKKTLGRWKRNSIFWNRSIEGVERRRGIEIAAALRLTKWSLFLNFALTISLSTILVPYLFPKIEPMTLLDANCQLPNNGNNTEIAMSQSMIKECCSIKYKMEFPKLNRSLYEISDPIAELGEQFKLVERSPFFYGFFERGRIHNLFGNWSYEEAVVYIAFIFFIFTFSFIFILIRICKGAKDSILKKEGLTYEYSNLILAGWESSTDSESGSKFKRKSLVHRMKSVLKEELQREETEDFGKRDVLKVWGIRFFVNFVVLALVLTIGISMFQLTRETLKKQNEPEILEYENLLYNLAAPAALLFTNFALRIFLRILGSIENVGESTRATLILIRSLLLFIASLGGCIFAIYTASYCEVEKSSCANCSEWTKGTSVGLKERLPCWESIYAQFAYKLLFVDILFKATITLFFEPLRILIGKCLRCSKHCEKVGLLRFNCLHEALDGIYIQTFTWIGVYFAPMLPIISTLYFFLLFYLKKISILINCKGTPRIFKGNRSLPLGIVQLASLVSAVVPIAFVILAMEPSKECGPFRNQKVPWNVIGDEGMIMKRSKEVLDQLCYPAVVVFLIVFSLLLYFRWVGEANRGMVASLKHLLVLEGHDKQYLFARLNTFRNKNGSSDHSEEISNPPHA